LRVAFDIDGVILDIDLGLIRAIDFIHNKEEEQEATRFYYVCRRPLLNPLDFLHEDDELYIITGRDEKFREITEKWAKRYFPSAKLIVLGHEEPTGDTIFEEWYVKQARRKAKALIENQIDIYFEDTAPVVRELRMMCPKTKIVQYGGRVDT